MIYLLICPCKDRIGRVIATRSLHIALIKAMGRS